ncbi:MAG: response regulator [Candidatus Zixiibacteriota bacterium]|nr:MAG: response regulator [candidate division Zixibacteria bacterium]
MAREKPVRIIIAEPDPSIADTLKEFLEHIGYEAITVDRRDDIVRVTVEQKCGVVIVDHLLNSAKATEILDELLAVDSTICVIILISCPLVEYVVGAFRKGAFDVVIKPVDLFELDEIVHRAFEQHETNKVRQFVTANLEDFRELMDRRTKGLDAHGNLVGSNSDK